MIQQFSIFSNKEIKVPIGWDGYNSGVWTQKVTWEPSSTITRATLTLRALSSGGSMACVVYMNDMNQNQGGVGWTSLEAGQWKQTTIDVTGRVANGNNNFLVDYYGTFGVNLTGTSAWVYLDLEIDSTGGVVVPPPKPPFDPTWLIYGGIIVVGGLIIWKLIIPAAKSEYGSYKKKLIGG
jgi:hypothetical protein